MAIACIHIPHFALRVAILAHPAWDGSPLVLRPPAGRREIVIDAVPEAMQRGIQRGMLLSKLPALCPDAIICAPHLVREQTILDRILDQLETFSPLVTADPVEPGTFYVDLRGLARLFGSSQAITRQLLATVPPLLRPRAGIAPNLIAARLAAGHASPGACHLVEAGELSAFLRDITITEIPMPNELRQQFEHLAIFTLGTLAALPPAAVAARFGPTGHQIWELAAGRDERRIHPRLHSPIVAEHSALDVPVTSREACLIALKRLVIQAFSRAPLQHRHVRQLTIKAQIEGGIPWERCLVLREPSGRDRILETLDLRLQQLSLPGPIEALTLELSGLTPATARQEPLLGLGARPHRPRQVSEAIRQLTQRYGDSPLYRIVEVEPWSRMPERRFALIRYAP